MGILQRFNDIMKSNINALLDKAEDPAKMVDQHLRDLRESLAEVKESTAEVMANESSAKRDVDACQANIDKYANAARNALKAGNEEDARKLLTSKQQYEAQLVGLKENLTVASANSEKMRQMYNKLTADIQSLENRRDTIKAKAATAKAQQKVNDMTAAGTNSTASIEAFDRMEAKVDKMLDAANAEAELNAEVTGTEDLAKKYGSDNSASVDDELAAMKKELGL